MTPSDASDGNEVCFDLIHHPHGNTTDAGIFDPLVTFYVPSCYARLAKALNDGSALVPNLHPQPLPGHSQCINDKQCKKHNQSHGHP